MIPAILLAAGMSERMGRLKQLIKFQGKSFVRHSVDNLQGAGINDVIVVTGHREEEVRYILAGCKVTFAHNPKYEKGMSTSIKSGVESLPADCQAFVLALADQPLIDSATIARLLNEYRTKMPLVLIPTFNGRKGHPIVISAALKPDILAMDEAATLKQVLSRYESATLLLPIETDTIVLDFDYPEDLERIEAEPD